MKMQDKGFDEAFRSKLDGMEIEPSADVWAGIDAGLSSTGKRKTKLMPWLSIAASIIVLITAGVLLAPKKVKVSPVNYGKVKPLSTPAIKPADSTAADLPALKDESAARMAAISSPKKAVRAKHGDKNAPGDDTPITAGNNEQVVLAAVSQKPVEVITYVVPDTATPLAAIQVPADAPVEVSSKPVQAAGQTNEAEQAVKKHRIRNFGDLFNIVVAKVDKRKDKFIVFSDSDGDESTVSAVNIGPVKIGPTPSSPEGKALK